MISNSRTRCFKLGHNTIRHSPDGVDVIIECPTCCAAWLIKAITGEEIRLHGSSYELRLTQQKLYQADIML